MFVQRVHGLVVLVAVTAVWDAGSSERPCHRGLCFQPVRKYQPRAANDGEGDGRVQPSV